MAKEFKGEALPFIAAQQGNPEGQRAEDDVIFGGVKVVAKGEFYSRAYLAAIEEGCKEKPKAEANKAVQPSENK